VAEHVLFSILPLRLAVVTGCLLPYPDSWYAFSFVELRRSDLPPGWASLMISILVVAGVQLVAIGMVGEYLGRMFMKDNGNPQFVVRRSVNCEA
jgi:undecaprenyl-phosphate 4-deoxy-4-formamido-L-arabinose transferase